MFRPTSMKRFYLAVPIEYEEVTLKKIVELSAVQLTRDIPVESVEKNELLELCQRFIRLYKRMKSIAGEVVLEKNAKEQSVVQPQVDARVVKSFLDKLETKLDESTKTIDKLQEDIGVLKVTEERLAFLRTYGLKIDQIDNFPHIFVKAGFINSASLPRLRSFTGGTSVVVVSGTARPRENLLAIIGLNEDRPLTEKILKLLNFEEFVFPENLNPDPARAVQEVRDRVRSDESQIQGTKESLARARIEFYAYELWVSTTLRVEEAKGLVARTKTKCLIHGWIPSEKTELLKSRIEEVVPAEKVYLKFEDPKPEDKVPVEFKNKGLIDSFAVFTNLQGVPDYFEVNPTAIYAILYVTMFGIMFGDIGCGAIFIVLGLIFTRLRKGLLMFSGRAARKIGLIFVTCGVSAVLFGFLYGEFFLTEITPPILLKPLDNIPEISVIALIFGVAQIMLAMVLNTINKLRKQDSLGAVFGSRSVTGIAYYSAGIFLAIAFINKMDFNVFLQQGVYVFTFIALVSLVLIFLSPTIEAFGRHKGARLTEKLVEGFGEGLETLIVLIANSVSYIRLAAFAIAHGALGLAAVIFAPIIGGLPSFILMNVIVFVIEGFAALIQSLRLMYYEFSTKFYVDGGIRYQPLRIIPLETKI